jgi:hypothetical protein
MGIAPGVEPRIGCVRICDFQALLRHPVFVLNIKSISMMLGRLLLEADA